MKILLLAVIVLAAFLVGLYYFAVWYDKKLKRDWERKYGPISTDHTDPTLE